MAKPTRYSGVVEVAADKLLLYWWEYEYYGAVLDLLLYWYRGTAKFCLEGTLTYARVAKLAEGSLCVEQHDNGDFTCSANATIRIGGNKVAKFDAHVTQNVDWNEGMWRLKKYDIEVCGTNTLQLKCKVWKKEFDNLAEAPELFIANPDAIGDSQFLLSRPEGVRDTIVIHGDADTADFHHDSNT